MEIEKVLFTLVVDPQLFCMFNGYNDEPARRKAGGLSGGPTAEEFIEVTTVCNKNLHGKVSGHPATNRGAWDCSPD